MRGNDVSKKNNVDMSFGMGLGVFFIVLGGLLFYYYPNSYLRIIWVLIFTFGFFGIASEFEKIKMRSSYKLSFGFCFLILAFWGYEYFNFIFIFFIALSSGVFFSALAEFLSVFDREYKEKYKSEKLEGVLSVVGSICSIVGLIIALMTL